MNARTRTAWWLAVIGCLFLLVGVAAAATIRPAQHRTVEFRAVPADTMRVVP